MTYKVEIPLPDEENGLVVLQENSRHGLRLAHPNEMILKNDNY